MQLKLVCINVCVMGEFMVSYAAFFDLGGVAEWLKAAVC